MKPGQHDHFIEFLYIMYPNGTKLRKLVDRAAKCYKAALDYIGPETLELRMATGYGVNNKIAMIKKVREVYGWGLKESKDAVDAISAGYPFVFKGTPEQHANMERALVDFPGVIVC
jgi:hypothetical protein